MPTVCNFSYGLSIATGVVGMSILETLVTKGVLTRDEVAGLLTDAMAAIDLDTRMSGASDAIRIIRDHWLPEYVGSEST